MTASDNEVKHVKISTQDFTTISRYDSTVIHMSNKLAIFGEISN